MNTSETFPLAVIMRLSRTNQMRETIFQFRNLLQKKHLLKVYMLLKNLTKKKEKNDFERGS